MAPTVAPTPSVAERAAAAAGQPLWQVQTQAIDDRLFDEIGQAAESSLLGRHDALWYRDPAIAREALVEAELTRVEDEIHLLTAQGRRVWEWRKDVSLSLARTGPGEALVTEDAVRSHLVTAASSDRELERQEGTDRTRVRYRMKKVGAVWLIAEASVPSPTPSLTSADDNSEQAGLDAVDLAWRHEHDQTWRAYVRLDPTGLEDVLAGNELARIVDHIGQLRAEGRAVGASMAWSPPVTTAAGDAALLYDEYRDQSVYRDAQTGKQLAPGPTPQIRRRVVARLQRLDGAWKVVAHEALDPPADGDGDTRPPGPPTTASPLSQAEAIGIAFGRSRQVMAQARATGDPAPLSEVLAGEALVQQQAAPGQQPPLERDLVSEHNYRVVALAPDVAEVYDQFVEGLATAPGEGSDASPPPEQHVAARLRLLDGGWKVVAEEAYK